MKRSLVMVLMSACAVVSVAEESLTAGGRKGVHGMVVFGDAQSGLFFSHIPMFHKPHDIQVVFSVRFDGGLEEARSYTFKPKPFALDDAIAGTLKTLEGELYEGNFENNGAFVRNLQVRIDGVAIAAKTLDKDVPTPAKLTYDVVGGRYLVHPIHGGDDFDQILVLADPIADVIVEVNAPNDLAHRLVKGAPVSDTTVLAELSKLRGPDFVD